MQNSTMQAAKPVRYEFLDALRGIILLSMIVYHTVWDLVNLFQISLPWYQGQGGFLWQQSICWGFILLSGFCWPFGHKPLKRGLTVFAAGLLVTAVTVLLMPNDRIVFGVLTFLGSAMLLMIPCEKILRKVPPVAGLICSMVLFLLLLNLKTGSIGIGGWKLATVPQQLYHGYFSTYLGFLDAGFYSADYFPLLPWILLFFVGYFLHRAVGKRGMEHQLLHVQIYPLNVLGKHTLILYMLHQPVIYLLLAAAFKKMP
ncbi:heparan-alpha-glucosaminide N-acetyltransferase [Caproicibacterium amylolyticum]|nr:heparan-alpha-glucosaminide N-acetyltransferase [Caproicibacterium amylolyticum]